MIARSTRSSMTPSNSPRARRVMLVLYYLAILIALVLLYGRGDFSTPDFVYQGF